MDVFSHSGNRSTVGLVLRHASKGLIICIRLVAGFIYLVAILDWFTRYVLSWLLSNTLDNLVCVDVLEQVLRVARRQVLNTDQGSQFTSRDSASRLEKAGVAISMDDLWRGL